MITCCRFCTERRLGCHSACPRYIAESDENARRLEAHHAAVEVAYGIQEEKARLPRHRKLYAAKEWG